MMLGDGERLSPSYERGELLAELLAELFAELLG